MATNKVMILRLFGPSLAEVSVFVRGLARMCDDVPICWDEHPEVVVKCSGPRIVQDICDKFGDAVYSIDGRSMEAVVGGLLAAGGHTVATAESCTGGLTGQMLTSVAGSSGYYAGGFITYSDDMKQSALGVPAELIRAHGAVSEQVAGAMASAARHAAGTDVAVSVTGIAGPTGGTESKPVGTVCFGLASSEGVRTCTKTFGGDRCEIRRSSAGFALDLVRRWCIRRRGRNVILGVDANDSLQ